MVFGHGAWLAQLFMGVQFHFKEAESLARAGARSKPAIRGLRRVAQRSEMPESLHVKSALASRVDVPTKMSGPLDKSAQLDEMAANKALAMPPLLRKPGLPAVAFGAFMPPLCGSNGEPSSHWVGRPSRLGGCAD